MNVPTVQRFGNDVHVSKNPHAAVDGQGMTLYGSHTRSEDIAKLPSSHWAPLKMSVGCL